jgi:hypothetical protein
MNTSTKKSLNEAECGNKSKPLLQAVHLFGGLDKYFSDLEDYEFSVCCDECGNEKLQFRRTTSNNEVHWCDKCKREQTTCKRPNEDDY